MPKTPVKKSQTKRSGKASSKGLTYAQSGVDIEAGDAVVGLIKSSMASTYGPRVMSQHGAFAGCFDLSSKKSYKQNWDQPMLVACTDGVGTKVLLAIEAKKLDGIGIDCVAMNVNDMIVQGAKPLFFLDYVGIHKVVPAQTAKIVEGVAEGCRQSGCALLGGETAEMPDVYKKGDFDLAGFAVGVVEKSSAMVGGGKVKEGDVVLGIASSGAHSNGYSLIRKIIDHAGLDLKTVYENVDEKRTLGEVLLEPTRIYVRSVMDLLDAYPKRSPISGMAHITGGGLPGNLNRALPEHLDARVVKSAWPVPPLFDFLREYGKVAEDEMYKVFNMGIGYTVIVRPGKVDEVQAKLEASGETVWQIGEIVPGKGKVRMVKR